ncbi:MAG: hypothetical protein UW03_C0016G0025 [Candidatus Peregrinibacteria bacterium GW2011_GWA2_43_8]|nr:MAG: hypothetical protein UW03_C0016G0025 [Candidatus Peregrinibacteria bacterium GW2011_GWA2_43_8]
MRQLVEMEIREQDRYQYKTENIRKKFPHNGEGSMGMLKKS